MSIDLGDSILRDRAGQRAWLTDPKAYWEGLTEATHDLGAPLVAIQADALSHNAHDLLRRAGGLPVRVASKSIRVREVLDRVLTLPGYAGVLAYSLAEAVWLSDTIDDIVVAYPTVDSGAIHDLVTDPQAARRVTIMVDSIEHLDVVDQVLPAGKRETVRVCLDFDASWHHALFGNVGVHRSPLHTPENLRALAEHIDARDGFTLVGVMSYEAQIAGVQNDPAGNPLKGRLMRTIQRASGRELRERRGRALELVREVADLEFVNGGGTGSIEHTVAEPGITEVAAGSGLFGPHIFDHYAHFAPAPAVAFAVDVVRTATRDSATAFGGGWIASGVSGADRSPQPVWPTGLRFGPREGAGEVQTPLMGDAARSLAIGDRVWMRHAKSGEVMEHVPEVHWVTDGHVVATTPTYRGEGKSFS